MDSGALFSIGDLARRTGLTVKAIRFYSDSGILPPTDRSPAGHRRYDADAVARLNLVRTLRSLGLDLPAIRKVADREVSLPDVAAVHAEALAAQIRLLLLRRAVLMAVARRGYTPEEMDHMHELARLSEDERRRLIGEFLDAAFGCVGSQPQLAESQLAAIRCSMTPELPDDPRAEQVQAWVELAELARDAGFRASLRSMAEQDAAERTQVNATALRPGPAAVVRDAAGPALEAGIDPASSQADPVVAAVMTHYARIVARPDDVSLRRRLLARLVIVNDPRRERYLQLLAVINGWPRQQSLAPALDWFIQALQARGNRMLPEAG
jgi:DNA-binding transcriptional MerR regulator